MLVFWVVMAVRGYVLDAKGLKEGTTCVFRAEVEFGSHRNLRIAYVCFISLERKLG
jgi:hypothetical protein